MAKYLSEKRELIIDYIAKQSCRQIAQRRIVQDLGMKYCDVSYHCRRMVEDKILESKRIGTLTIFRLL